MCTAKSISMKVLWGEETSGDGKENQMLWVNSSRSVLSYCLFVALFFPLTVLHGLSFPGCK